MDELVSVPRVERGAERVVVRAGGRIVVVLEGVDPEVGRPDRPDPRRARTMAAQPRVPQLRPVPADDGVHLVSPAGEPVR